MGKQSRLNEMRGALLLLVVVNGQLSSFSSISSDVIDFDDIASESDYSASTINDGRYGRNSRYRNRGRRRQRPRRVDWDESSDSSSDLSASTINDRNSEYTFDSVDDTWTITDQAEASFLDLESYESHHWVTFGATIGVIIILYYLVFRQNGRYRHLLPW